jgi:hypothetical protein
MLIFTFLVVSTSHAGQIDRCVLQSGQPDCVAWKDDNKVLVSKAAHKSVNIIQTVTEKRKDIALKNLENKHQIVRKNYEQQLAKLNEKQSVKVFLCDFEGCE